MAKLNTYDLRAMMEGDPEFVGVFASDRLPTLANRHGTVKLIVNLDDSSLPGSHWVAIYRRGGKAYYFDTFGHEPPKIIRNWIANNSTSWTSFARAIQSPQDKESCGYLCLEFLQRL